MANTMVMSQPAAVGSVIVSNQWSTGLFDCFDDWPTCCFSFWCFWCSACIMAREYGECLCLPLVDLYGLGGCVPAVAMAMRADMRQRYGIQGNLGQDLIYSAYCGICVYCQMSREMKIRKQPVTILNVPSQHGNILPASS